MSVDRNVILSIFIVSAMSMAMSRDCIPGKEFLSTFFHTKGTCVLCPRSLKNCKDQGSLADISACKNSCGKSMFFTLALSRIVLYIKITMDMSYRALCYVNVSVGVYIYLT
jgi:hypothetical protein